MKVKIGNYPNRLTCRIHTRYMDRKYGYIDWPIKQSGFENSLERLEDFVQTLYSPINYFLDKRTQKIKVKIDRWDTWSMDHTLAYIVLPMLIQLKKDKHGAPKVDMTDVPQHLRVNDPESKEFWSNGETDEKWFDRWEWVLDEMIYAFDCKANKDDVFMRLEDPDAIQAEQERISNGFRLFGKYYEGLWD